MEKIKEIIYKGLKIKGWDTTLVDGELITDIANIIKTHNSPPIPEYVPIFSKAQIDWFTNNYIENYEQIAFLIDKGVKKYSFSYHEIYDGCVEFRKGRNDKDLLETHINLIGKMTAMGIKASIAGVKLREALLESGNTKPLPKLIVSLIVEHNIRVGLNHPQTALPIWAINLIHKTYKNPLIDFKME